LIQEGRHHLRAVWFNQPFMTQKFRQGQTVLFSGTVKHWGLMWEMVHPTVKWLDESSEPARGELLPVYRLCEGLKQRHVRRAVENVLAGYAEELDDVFSPEFLQQHQLWPLGQALRQLHFPENAQSLQQARRRLVYQELFLLQLGLALRRRQHRTGRSAALAATAQIDARIRRLFPFELTAGQNQAIGEIAADMGRDVPMNRLLQGDVGSGKTVVALYGMLLAVAHRHQAALMAPTEILARQHHETLTRLLAGSQVRMLLLRGGLNSKERESTLGAIAAGDFDLIVGTQAMIQDDVRFHALGLVVIDEQHKFGVRQRASLKSAGLQPHYLVMTATPIPRTVTMAFYGDLDLSLLKDSPPGRQPLHAYLAEESQRAKWWDFFRRKLREGRQGYVVVPRVEEGVAGSGFRVQDAEVSQASGGRQPPGGVAAEPPQSIESAYEALANGELEEFRIGLLHGRLSAEEKDATMAAFRRGDLQVLVCTTVVEVGLDVPAATLMTIENAERFGLSQLHQLRGRISRGSHPGYCAVFADPKTDDARRRLEAFISTTDGFRLAEIDFELRGPGDLFGTRQHGLPPLRIADLIRDAAVVEEARRDAQALVESDPELTRPDNALLRERMLRRYEQSLELGDVG
jgi:ATP-dependent DNA helicase RecG